MDKFYFEMIDQLKSFKSSVKLKGDNIENEEIDDSASYDDKDILEALENVEKNEEVMLENFNILKVRNKIVRDLTLVIHCFF